jgi:hypothetical protein
MLFRPERRRMTEKRQHEIRMDVDDLLEQIMYSLGGADHADHREKTNASN